MNTKKRNNIIILKVLFIAWLIITFVSATTHEPWIDEIYAWQISKFSIRDIFYEMRYEGHFALWYLILYPFSHLNAPLKWLNILSWFINSISILYFVYKSPFNALEKISLMFSSIFLYYYPVISRCYVLLPIMLFILADLYSRYLVNDDDYVFLCMCIVIGLIANVHVYTEGFAISMGLILFIDVIKKWNTYSFKERNKRVFSLSIPIVLALIAFLQVLPSLNYSSVFVSGNEMGGGIQVFLSSIGISNRIEKLLTILLVIITIVYITAKDFRLGFVSIISMAYMAAINKLVYSSLIPNRNSMWFLFIIFSLWIVSKKRIDCKNDTTTKIITSLFIISISLFTFDVDLNLFDYKNKYSGESIFADYVKNNIKEDECLYSNPNPWCEAIIEYLPNYNIRNIENGLILKKDVDPKKINIGFAINEIESLFSNNENEYIYIIDCINSTDNNSKIIIEELGLGYEYEILYPHNNNDDYFLKYYLIKVQNTK